MAVAASSLPRWPRGVLIAALLIAADDLLGWSIGRTVFSRTCSGWHQMLPWVSAWASALAIAALVRLLRRRTYSQAVSASLALAVCVTAAVALFEEIVGGARPLGHMLWDEQFRALGCERQGGVPVGAAVVALCLGITVLAVDATSRPLQLLWFTAWLVGTALALAGALSPAARSGFLQIPVTPEVSVLGALLFALIGLAVGATRAAGAPWDLLLRGPRSVSLARTLIVLLLFPSGLLLLGSLLDGLGLAEQTAESWSILFATLIVAAATYRFNAMQEREVYARIELARALEVSEAHYRLLAENSADIVAKFATDNAVEWISPSVTQALGWAPHELIGARAEALIHPEDLEVLAASRSQLAREGRTSYRARFHTRDGAYRWIGVRARVVIDDRGNRTGVSASLRDIQHDVEAEQQLYAQARIDALTGLQNRAEAYARLSEVLSRRDDAGLAVLFCDMDNLKALNDAWGHAVGDLVLQVLAKRILTAVRSGDLAARLGGDEFLIGLLGVRDAAEARRLAERIRQLAQRPIEVQGSAVTTTLSIGVALAHPGDDVEAILLRADHAMYRAKAGGRNAVVLAHVDE